MPGKRWAVELPAKFRKVAGSAIGPNLPTQIARRLDLTTIKLFEILPRLVERDQVYVKPGRVPHRIISEHADKLRILRGITSNKVAQVVVNQHVFVTELGKERQSVADFAATVFAPELRTNFNVQTGLGAFQEGRSSAQGPQVVAININLDEISSRVSQGAAAAEPPTLSTWAVPSVSFKRAPLA
jgi:hypothetical protein